MEKNIIELKLAELSNPSSTGGEGIYFENEIQAYFLLLMLTGGFIPFFPQFPISKIKLQGKYAGYNIDDLIIFIENKETREQRKLLGQIKHSIAIGNNKTFVEVINAAWKDFNNTDVFNKGKDRIALITGPLSKKDISNVRTLLSWVHTCEDYNDFFMKINLPSFSSKEKIEKIKIFRDVLKISNNGVDLADKDFFEFLKHFTILSFDLDENNGIIHSLLNTIVGHYSLEMVNIKPLLIDEIKYFNKTAGVLTFNTISENLKKIFIKQTNKDTSIYNIQYELTSFLASSFSTEFAIAALIGAWNEENEYDKKIIEKVTGETYLNWIKKIRELDHKNSNLISFNNGIWKISKRKEIFEHFGEKIFNNTLITLKESALIVLKEIDPQFGLSSSERLLAQMNNKRLKHSSLIRKNISEAIAIITNERSYLKNCTNTQINEIEYNTLRALFENMSTPLMGSLNDVFSALAEVCPKVFLEEIKKTIKSTLGIFIDLVKNETKDIWSINYTHGFYGGLSILTKIEEHFFDSVTLLFELAVLELTEKEQSNAFNTLEILFLPWYLQVFVPIKKIEILFKQLLKLDRDCSLKLFKALLRGTTSTSDTSLPQWITIENIQLPRKLSEKEYNQYIDIISNLYVENSVSSIKNTKELIENIESLTYSSIKILISLLESEELINGSEENKTVIWEELQSLLANKSYFKKDFPFFEEFKTLVSKFEPKDKILFYSRLFCERSKELLEEKMSYEEAETHITTMRKEALDELLSLFSLKELDRLIYMVESSYSLGRSLGHISNDIIDNYYLPTYLGSLDDKVKSFIRGYIIVRYNEIKNGIFENLELLLWEKNKISSFLLELPFEKDTWIKVEDLLKENENLYWQKIYFNSYFPRENREYAIEKLLLYKRPLDAIDILESNLHLEQNVDIEMVLYALNSVIIERAELYPSAIYKIEELFNYLYTLKDIDRDKIVSLEWAYLSVLDKKECSPKYLIEKLSTDTKFLLEILSLVYIDDKKKVSVKKEVASNAFKLLRMWKNIPSMVLNEFNSVKFENYLSEFKNISEDTIFYKKGLIFIGTTLFYVFFAT